MMWYESELAAIMLVAFCVTTFVYITALILDDWAAPKGGRDDS